MLTSGNCRRISSSRSARRAVITIGSPASANCNANARPIPLLAPVIRVNRSSMNKRYHNCHPRGINHWRIGPAVYFRKMIRVGMGYDVHRFATGRRLVLGGVHIDHDRGLDGHSDADVLIHAIADALLGALGEPDIGFHFPNDDPQWKDVSSLTFLEQIRDMLAERHACLSNLDSSLIAEEPRILPHLDAMKSAISSALAIEPGQVGIKATTNESMGFVGRGEGIAAMAVACLEFTAKYHA